MSIEIKLPSGHIALIDDCDADLAGRSWYCNTSGKNFYAAHRYAHKTTYLHRAILSRLLGRELVKGEVVDHIDGDGLNNTRSNLRLATQSQNMGNQGRSIANTSGFKGVSWHKGRGKWQAQIKVGRVNKWIGCYDDPAEAHAAYMTAACELFGEFANNGKGGAK